MFQFISNIFERSLAKFCSLDLIINEECARLVFVLFGRTNGSSSNEIDACCCCWSGKPELKMLRTSNDFVKPGNEQPQ